MEVLTKSAENFSECPNAFKYLESLTIARSCSCHDSNYIETSDIIYLNAFLILCDTDTYEVLLIAKCPHCGKVTIYNFIYNEAEHERVIGHFLHSNELLNLYYIYKNFSPSDTLVNIIASPMRFMQTTFANLVKFYMFQQSIKCSLDYSLANYTTLLAKTVISRKIPNELQGVINSYTLLPIIKKGKYVITTYSIYKNIPYDTIRQLLYSESLDTLNK